MKTAIHNDYGLERKDASGGEGNGGNEPAPSTEMKKAFDTFLQTFEAFKTKNDAELAEIKKSQKPGNAPGADAVTVEEVKKLNDALTAQQKTIDELRLAAKRPKLPTDSKGRELTEVEVKHRDAFLDYVRKGDASGYGAAELKTLSVGSNPDGGYTVTPEVEANIDRLLSQVSPVRQIATVRQISTSEYKKPMNLGGATSGWVGEQSSRPQTNTPTLDMLSFPAMELYAMPAATQAILDDSAINMEQWLADEVQIVFAEQEGAAFVTGNGVNKPMGFAAAEVTKVANASWAWGKIGYVLTGQSGGFAADPDGGNAIIDLVYAVKSAYRSSARFVMNRLTQAAVRKLQDSNGQYIWQPGLIAGQPATLLSYPITEAEDMTDIAADSYSIAFGDFKRGYLIVDRIGTRVLRDPYSNKPYVLFYTTKRVGGGVQNFEAYKFLKFGTA